MAIKTIKGVFRAERKKRPKTYAKIDRRWDIKMIGPVSDFVFSILDDVNPRLKNLSKKHEYIIKGPEIERRLWRLLKKCRRMTQLEK